MHAFTMRRGGGTFTSGTRRHRPFALLGDPDAALIHMATLAAVALHTPDPTVQACGLFLGSAVSSAKRSWTATRAVLQTKLCFAVARSHKLPRLSAWHLHLAREMSRLAHRSTMAPLLGRAQSAR